MSANILDFIKNTLGIVPNNWNNFRGKYQEMLNRAGDFVEIRRVAAGTPTGNFSAQWTNYGFAVPQVAMVYEGTNIWFTYNNGSSWSAATLASSDPVGTIKITLDKTAPSGWLFLDGTAYSISSYSALNTYLSTNYTAAERRVAVKQTAWASASQATFAFSQPIGGIANSDSFNLYWNNGSSSRLSMTASSVSTTSMVLSGGSGDNIPNNFASLVRTQGYRIDFAANKFFVPDARNKTIVGAEKMGTNTLATNSRMPMTAKTDSTNTVTTFGTIFPVNVIIKA